MRSVYIFFLIYLESILLIFSNLRSKFNVIHKFIKRRNFQNVETIHRFFQSFQSFAFLKFKRIMNFSLFIKITPPQKKFQKYQLHIIKIQEIIKFFDGFFEGSLAFLVFLNIIFHSFEIFRKIDIFTTFGFVFRFFPECRQLFSSNKDRF